MNSVSQMDCFQGGPLQWAVITEETDYRIYVWFDFTKDRELNYAWKIHSRDKIAVLLIRSIIRKKKLKKKKEKKKEKEYGGRISSWTSFNQLFDRDQRTSWKRSRLMSTTSRVLGTQLYFLVMYSMNSFRVPITQHRHIYIYTALAILLYFI